MILLKVRCTHDTRNTIKVGSLPERNGILGLVNLFATLKRNWDELTFAKTPRTVTRDQVKKWPIADRDASQACLASVSVRFRSQERGTRVIFRRASVFLCSETTRKRLLCRLTRQLTNNRPYSLPSIFARALGLMA